MLFSLLQKTVQIKDKFFLLMDPELYLHLLSTIPCLAYQSGKNVYNIYNTRKVQYGD
jgi:hypothetical protein